MRDIRARSQYRSTTASHPLWTSHPVLLDRATLPLEDAGNRIQRPEQRGLYTSVLVARVKSVWKWFPASVVSSCSSGPSTQVSSEDDGPLSPDLDLGRRRSLMPRTMREVRMEYIERLMLGDGTRLSGKRVDMQVEMQGIDASRRVRRGNI
jgi:hypothetical protein